MSATRRTICIVGLDSYGMLSGEGDLRYIGGEFVQHVLLARAWRDLGHDVSIIVHDEGQGPRRVIDGITAIAAYSRRGGLPGLRFFHPRGSKLVAALSTADADVYYQRCAAVQTGYVAAFCARNGKKSIYAGASDVDFIPGKQDIVYARDRFIFEQGLQRVDRVFVQNPE